MHKRKMFLPALIALAVLGCTPTAHHAENQGPERTVAQNAQASKINVQLGLGYLQQGKRELAKTKLLTALEQAPTSAQANDAMAYLLEANGELEKAEEFYKKALSYGRGKGAPLNNYGAYLCRHGQYAKSEEYFLAALKDPNYISVADAYENAGLCTLQIPNVEKAKTYFAMALKQDPKRANSMLELAQLNFNEGKVIEANHYLKQYTELAAANAQSTWLSYQIAEQLGHREDAVSAAMLLKSNFVESKEYQNYLASQGKRSV